MWMANFTVHYAASFCSSRVACHSRQVGSSVRPSLALSLSLDARAQGREFGSVFTTLYVYWWGPPPTACSVESTPYDSWDVGDSIVD